MTVAQALSEGNVDDAATAINLTDAVEGDIASVTARRRMTMATGSNPSATDDTSRDSALISMTGRLVLTLCLLGFSSPVLALNQASQPERRQAGQATEQQSDSETGDETPDLRMWIGGGRYQMEDFNEKLRGEDNAVVNSGLTVGIEFSVISLPIPRVGITFKAPLGVEYLDASSKTVHTLGSASATVNWHIPVIGVFLAPTIYFPEKSHLYVRPIGVGIYRLGGLVDAKLTVSDRPGKLEVSDNAIGILSQIGVRFVADETEIFFEAGYRHLSFDDVSQTPKDGFIVMPGGPFVQPGNLPETLDYSGVTVKAGLGIKF